MTHKKKTVLTAIVAVVVCGLLSGVLLIYHDYIILRDSAFYADGPVGFVGEIPSTVKAYNRLVMIPFAEHIFRKLEISGTNSAKAYAITALREIDPIYASVLLDKYANSEETTSVFYDCIGYDVLLKDFFD